MDINLTVLKRNGETYVFLYDDDHIQQAMREAVKFACNSELSFDFQDAKNVTNRMRDAACNHA